MSVTFHRLHVFAPGIHGVIIEPASAPSDAEAGQGEGWGVPSSVAPPTLSPSGDPSATETDGGSHEVASEQDSDTSGLTCETPPGADTGSAVESGAQVSVFDRSTGAASVTTDECGGQPSPDCSGSVSEAREQSEKVGTEGKDCNAPGLAVRAVQYLAGQGASSPAPIPGPVDEWADLDIPARFDRREKAA